MLELFLTKDSWVGDLLCSVPFCSEACLFFSDDLFRLWLQSVQYDLQHDFAWVADEADRARTGSEQQKLDDLSNYTPGPKEEDI